jgi:hypothetical protein
VETALREGKIGYEESGRLLRFYEDGLRGYTYLAEAHQARLDMHTAHKEVGGETERYSDDCREVKMAAPVDCDACVAAWLGGIRVVPSVTDHRPSCYAIYQPFGG